MNKIIGFLLIMLSSTVLQAEPIEETLNGFKNPLTLSGKVMEIGPDFISVAETKVFVVDRVVNGVACRTEIKEQSGAPVRLETLAVGDVVMVKGGGVLDWDMGGEVVFARIVYLGDKDGRFDEALHKALVTKW